MSSLCRRKPAIRIIYYLALWKTKNLYQYATKNEATKVEIYIPFTALEEIADEFRDWAWSFLFLMDWKLDQLSKHKDAQKLIDTSISN